MTLPKNLAPVATTAIARFLFCRLNRLLFSSFG